MKDTFSKALILIAWVVIIVYSFSTVSIHTYMVSNSFKLIIGTYLLFIGTLVYFKARNYPPSINFLLLSISTCFTLIFIHSDNLILNKVGLAFLVLCPALLYFFLYSFIQGKKSIFFQMNLLVLTIISAISELVFLTKYFANCSLIILLVSTLISCFLIIFKAKSFFFQSKDYYLLSISILFSYFPFTLFYFLSTIYENISYPFSFLSYFSLFSVIIFPTTIVYLLIRSKIIVFKHDSYLIISSILCTVMFTISLFLLDLDENKKIIIILLFSIMMAVNLLINTKLKNKKLKKLKEITRNLSNERIELLNQITYSNLSNTVSKLILKSLTQSADVEDILVTTQSDSNYIVICEKGTKISKSVKKMMKHMKIEIQQLEIENQAYLCIPVPQPSEVVWVFLGQRKNHVRFSQFDIDIIIETTEQYTMILNMMKLLHESQQKYISSSFITNNLIQTKLFNNIESEKMNYANYLHDHILQSIIGLSTLVSNLTGDSEITDLIDREFTRLVQSIRNQIFDTFPSTLYNVSFEDNIKILMADFDKKKPDKIESLILKISVKKELPKHIIAPAYRIIKELNENILKHSLATVATTTLFTQNQYLHIIVEDNGIGINDYKKFEEISFQPKQHIGLLSIKNDLNWLNGSFELVRKTNSEIGTKIRIKIPLKEEVAHEHTVD
ncbi:ATP-binding protein [Vagococcus entomophilus]|uniref:Histidine kinase/HSP90-like ATPase domain-containing protein n=1 Tax=Vagococcus entomophilus TaxID=1160095 RepID=A0A430AK27_9ENTE|nr:ATP-binding protein [Vagococcus entomophilus]RSU08334.1 hypothetical protein CBF30_03580 [Vagococcus entomophilus]